MPITIYPKGGGKSLLCTAENVKSFFAIEWLNEIIFSSRLTRWRSAVSHRIAHYSKWVHPRQKWLGHYFAKELGKERFPHLAISWIDDRLGYGLFAEQSLPSFSYIGEYAGVVRLRPLFGALKNPYLFEYFIAEGLGTPYVIDARRYGNHVRFINHGCNPNAETASAWHQGRSRIIVHTSQPISPGEQISYDYGMDYWIRREQPIAIPKTR